MSKEIVETKSGEIVQMPDRGFSPIAIDDMVNKLDYIEQFKQRVLKKDSDYGIVPGTKKPTLYKAGAEKLGMAFNLNAEYSVVSSIEEPFREWEYDSGRGVQKTRGYFKYTVSCKVYNKTTGELWGSQLAECDSLERGREIAPSNTILKMAEKRAYVGAILNATFTSDRFTQDMEDYSDKSAPQNKSTGEKVSPQNYQDGFPSKYGSKEKPNFCVFCETNHVVQGDRIIKDDVSGKYGAVVCKQVNDNKPKEKVDPRIEKIMDYDLDNVLEMVQNTEVECFGDPADERVMAETLSARYKACNEGILKIKTLEKNNKGELARYMMFLCDKYKEETV